MNFKNFSWVMTVRVAPNHLPYQFFFSSYFPNNKRGVLLPNMFSKMFEFTLFKIYFGKEQGITKWFPDLVTSKAQEKTISCTPLNHKGDRNIEPLYVA